MMAFSIASLGLADIDFMIETGRMPIQDGDAAPVKRKSPRYTSDQVQAAAMADEKIVELLAGAAPRKVVVVLGKMVSIVP